MNRARMRRFGIAAGLSASEAMVMYPGEVYDLFELYLRANNLKPKKEAD